MPSGAAGAAAGAALPAHPSSFGGAAGRGSSASRVVGKSLRRGVATRGSHLPEYAAVRPSSCEGGGQGEASEASTSVVTQSRKMTKPA